MENINKKYYCPTCNKELEMLSGCGAVGYFCNQCRKLVSRSKMLLEPAEEPLTDTQGLPTLDKL
jgi:hypothetical protein